MFVSQTGKIPMRAAAKTRRATSTLLKPGKRDHGDRHIRGNAMQNQLTRFAPKAVRLISLPTPFEPLSHLSRLLGGPRIWMKRDDCTTLGGGGNKSRKLELLMAAAIEEGADTVITTGALQSNHCRQTAAAAAKLDLECILILVESVEGRAVSYNTGGNVLLSHLFGADVRRFPDGTDGAAAMSEVAEQLRSRGKHPYIIPLGGSNALGSAAYAHAIDEIKTQATAVHADIDTIIVATGSGGTHAGLLAGIAMNNSSMTVQGISVAKPAADISPLLHSLTIDTLKELKSAARPASDVVKIDDRFIGDGYGQPTDEMLEAVTLLARCEGLLLDPVYSGKAMAGLIQLVREQAFDKASDILFWHTGGSVGLFAYDDIFSLPALERSRP